jgi:hypothetical protein
MAVDWNAGNAAHLLRRAGFAARPKDVKKALKNGLGKTVSNLFKADKTSDKWKGEDKYPGGTAEMQSFWIRRMLATSSPLIERKSRERATAVQAEPHAAEDGTREIR